MKKIEKINVLVSLIPKYKKKLTQMAFERGVGMGTIIEGLLDKVKKEK